MKVYVKKGNCQSIIPGVLLTSVFLIISICLIFKILFSGNFLNSLYKNGFTLAFAFVFLGFGLYFLWLLLKKPKEYTGNLVYKKEEDYNGKRIIVMEFKTIKDKGNNYDLVPDSFICYTYDNNYLKVGENYSIFIKEFNWQIVGASDTVSNDILYMRSSTLLPVIIAIEFIFVFQVVLGFIGLLYFKENRIIFLAIINIFGISSVLVFIKYILFERNNKND